MISQQMNRKQLFYILLIGIGVGFLSGLFAVGGGMIIVPALISIVGFSPRLAAGTSLTAIIPLSLVGVISYAIDENVSWSAAGLLSVGAIVGSQIGTWLLTKISQKGIQIFFTCFLVVIILMMFIHVPNRNSNFQISLYVCIALIFVGFVVGILSGFLGIGGGGIIVPILMLVFGTSDLLAKGTSLLMMVLAALSGSVSNMRRGSLDPKVALLIGIPACIVTPLGTMVAKYISPQTSNLLFAGFLLFILLKMIRNILQTPKK